MVQLNRLCLVAVLSGLAGFSAAGQTRPAASAPAAIVNPVLPGDYPDPSVVKIGDTYWASATTSDWGPIFPLLKSKNLQQWELVGHVFPKGKPEWADHYFWAPEISQDGGRTYVYYAAHKKRGNLAVGVDSADKPEGPYRDHGFLVNQPDGSIDGFPMRDENGQLYLIWKEDGNSIQQPTPIWAQPMNADRTALTGEKKELFRNDPGTWEGGLVEGVSMVRHGGYIYAFYAGNGCCGNGCTYATGVARAKSLLGPWEKNTANPVLTSNDAWQCPGHGTAVERDGRWYMLHHAYAKQGFQHIGRQGVLSEFTWNAQGWPEFAGRGVPGGAAPAAVLQKADVRDEFAKTTLSPDWQWPVEATPTFAVRNGQLQLTARPGGSGAVLGHGIFAAGYTAQVALPNASTVPAGTLAGLAAVGNADNSVALTVSGRQLQLWQREKGQQKVLAEMPLPASKAPLLLRLRVADATNYRFDYSTTNGRTWQALPGAGAAAINGSFLPPWDLGVRVGVLAKGPAGSTVTFDNFSLKNHSALQ
ncbi:MAG: glycoside hydrolase family protein [Hymenobacter sp.]|nr:glycoside hydrolase family protein [Hymenobacter sp.]